MNSFIKENYLVIGIFIFIVFDFLLTIFLLMRRRKGGLSGNDLKFFVAKWEDLYGISMSDPRFAILEADKLLDKILTKKGYVGSVADKLKTAEKLFSDIDSVWSAHKMRNRIAHEIGYKISPSETQFALRAFKRALTDSGVKF